MYDPRFFAHVRHSAMINFSALARGSTGGDKGILMRLFFQPGNSKRRASILAAMVDSSPSVNGFPAPKSFSRDLVATRNSSTVCAEAVYRRYAIVCEADLTEGLKKLAAQEALLREKMQPCGSVTDFSHSLATVPARNKQNTHENMAEGARFELADPLRGLQFSRLARSATPSPLHH